MFGEFRAFLLKTNALALAVGVILGVALGNVVSSLVKDIIMPPIGLVLGNVDFANLKIVLQSNPEVSINYGTFINTIITFVVVAFVVFAIARLLIKEPAPAQVKTCPFCKEPNALDATKCKACTSTI
jgi:large conductance mechanosensitive channel